MDGVLIVVIVVLMAWTWWRLGLRKRELQRASAERESLLRRIEKDPKNLGAYEALGDNFLRLRRIQEAVQAYLAALELARVDGADVKSEYQIKYKLRQIEIGQAAVQPFDPNAVRIENVLCRSCGASNAPDSQRCETCGSVLLTNTFSNAFRLTFQVPHERQAMLETAIMIAVILLIVSFVSILPNDFKGLLAVSASITLVGRLIWSLQAE
ncbi:MAG: hypothetical protein ACLQVD_08315 [Capsulimonadaceae bacterium]